jgi:hypothetical protein
VTNYERLLRERVEMRASDLMNIDGPHKAWLGFSAAVKTPDMSIETLEQMCVELACQMFAFSSRRASHLPILSAFRDRDECEREERAVLARIRMGCEGEKE